MNGAEGTRSGEPGSRQEELSADYGLQDLWERQMGWTCRWAEVSVEVCREGVADNTRAGEESWHCRGVALLCQGDR